VLCAHGPLPALCAQAPHYRNFPAEPARLERLAAAVEAVVTSGGAKCADAAATMIWRCGAAAGAAATKSEAMKGSVAAAVARGFSRSVRQSVQMYVETHRGASFVCPKVGPCPSSQPCISLVACMDEVLGPQL
jgi:hypothetical protein